MTPSQNEISRLELANAAAAKIVAAHGDLGLDDSEENVHFRNVRDIILAESEA